ncbi:MAG: 23S rRNA (guanosine(2251)-2'-O)-methyltransferase RlmB [Gammaproteobacteria bacterium]|nr:23S rRNA (guanosine(2251)-2'-O)-methyltransferase RlmB [Gammaproteobacteria bacterium]
MSAAGQGVSHLIAGLHSVRTALKHSSASVSELWVEARRRDQRIRELTSMAERAGIPVHQAERETLAKLLPEVNHQGVVARTLLPVSRDEASLHQLLAQLDHPPLLLVLDGVQDPHNLGACLRTADAAGVDAVVAPKDRSVGLTPVACKVASGAAEQVPFVQVTNLARTLKRLQQEHGIWLVGTSGDAQESLYHADLKGPLALIMGGEEKGLRRLTWEVCDFLVRLPMAGTVESLNVSVACGVALYEAVRQRVSAAG